MSWATLTEEKNLVEPVHVKSCNKFKKIDYDKKTKPTKGPSRKVMQRIDIPA